MMNGNYNKRGFMNPKDTKSEGSYWDHRFDDQAKVITESSKIPWLGGRPERDTIIDKEDICNLKIALGQYPDVKDFVKHT
jgi:hypothetical protein